MAARLFRNMLEPAQARIDALLPLVPHYGYGMVKALCQGYTFRLRLAPPRRSKLGDFTALRGVFTITLNRDLPPDLMLVTYLHEVAHLMDFMSRTRRAEPHGPRWQAAFAKLLRELCHSAPVPYELKAALLRHAEAPKATLAADPKLAHLLEAETLWPIPLPQPGTCGLDEVATGKVFTFKGRPFIKSGKLSRRHYATELPTGRMFSFSANCRVAPLAEMPVPYKSIELRLGAGLAEGEQFVHRGRRLKLERKERAKLHCRDVATGRLAVLHPLMHVVPS